MIQEKEYFAFISYQRKDEELAEWLRKKLEHYHLPSSVRKQDASLPKEIRPIFRDTLELAGGVLAKEIETALQQSKFLIVICSRNSAKSPWVNKEIHTFIDLGCEDRIIPFIIDGSPFSDDGETECFPPALRSLKGEKELLGININELGRDAAFIKVVARMFDLKFDTLWQRYEREKKRKRWMMIGGVLLFAIAATVIASIFFNLNNELKNTINDRDGALHLADSALTQVRKDSVVLAEHLKRIMRDSLTLANQKDSIRLQKDEIAMERDNVKSANYQMKLNLSRVWAKEASKLVDEGDSYLARLIALEALPPNLPYTVEAEGALRKASLHNNAILHGDAYSANVFSEDNKRLASGGKTIRVWDTYTGVCSNVLRGHLFNVHSLSFHGNKLASASSDKDIRIWDVAKDDCVMFLEEHLTSVNSVSYGKDGKLLISGDESGKILIWDTEKWTYDTIQETGSPVYSVLLNHIGKICISGHADGMIVFWDLSIKPYKKLKTIKGHKSLVKSVSYSPNEKLIVSASQDGTAKIWDIATDSCIIILKGHNGYTESAYFSPDGKYIVTASSDKTNKVWDVNSGECIHTNYESNRVRSAIFSSDGKWIASSNDDGIVHLWEWGWNHTIVDTKRYRQYPTVFALCSSNNQAIIYSSNYKILGRWNLVTGETIKNKNLSASEGSIKSINYWQDKYFITSDSHNYLKKWDAEKMNVIKEVRTCPANHACWATSIIVNSRLKQIMTICIDSKVRIYDMDLNPLFTFDECINGIYSLDNIYFQTVHTAGDIKIHDPNNGKVLKTIKLNIKQGERIKSAVFSKDGTMLSASIGGKCIIWDIIKDRIISATDELNGIESPKSVFSPDGKRLLSFGGTKSLFYMWDVGSGKCIQVFDEHKKSINDIVFSDDGRYIFTGSSDGTIKKFYSPPLQELIKSTRERFKDRQLTPEELRKYYLE